MGEQLREEPIKPRPVWVYGCLLVIVLGIIAVAYFRFGLKDVLRGRPAETAALQEVAQTYLRHLDAKEYDAAYLMADKLQQERLPLDQLKRQAEQALGALGSFQSSTVESISVDKTTMTKHAAVMLAARFANGPATVNFTLVEVDGVWKIAGVNYASDLFQRP